MIIFTIQMYSVFYHFLILFGSLVGLSSLPQKPFWKAQMLSLDLKMYNKFVAVVQIAKATEDTHLCITRMAAVRTIKPVSVDCTRSD